MKDTRYIIAILLTCTAFVAIAVGVVTKWVYVVPFMRRRCGTRAVFKGLFGFGFGLGQDLEYLRLARECGSEEQKRVAFVIKLAGAVFFTAFILLAIIVLLDLWEG